MKAVIRETWGGPVRVVDLPIPQPGNREVLVRVRASSVNAADRFFWRGDPKMMRLSGLGIRRPKNPQFGMDLAGIVEATGPQVTEFSPGDQVVGTSNAAFAEYAICKPQHLVRKPESISFEAAAALPIAGLAAQDAMRTAGEIDSTSRVLVIGAGGGVGHFLLQLASDAGAQVTAVVSTPKISAIRDLGAHDVVDYTQNTLTERADEFDVIFDVAGARSLAELDRLVVKGGRVVMVGDGRENSLFGPIGRLIRGSVKSILTSTSFKWYVSTMNPDGLQTLIDSAERRILSPRIAEHYRLEDTGVALGQLLTGAHVGKLVLVP